MPYNNPYRMPNRPRPRVTDDLMDSFYRSIEGLGGKDARAKIEGIVDDPEKALFDEISRRMDPAEEQSNFIGQMSRRRDEVQQREVLRKRGVEEMMRGPVESGNRMAQMRKAQEAMKRRMIAHKQAAQARKARVGQRSAMGSIGEKVGKGAMAYRNAMAANEAQSAGQLQGMGLGGAGGEALPQMQGQNPYIAGMRGAGMLGESGGGAASALSNVGPWASQGMPAGAGAYGYGTTGYQMTEPLSGAAGSTAGSVASGVGYGLKGALQAVWDQNRKAQQITDRTGRPPRQAGFGDYVMSGLSGGEYPKDAAPYGPGSMGSFSTAALDPIWSLFGQNGMGAKGAVSDAINYVGGGINPFAWYSRLFGGG